MLNGDGRGLLQGERPPSTGAASGGPAAPPVVRLRDYSTEKDSIRKGLTRKASALPELAGLTVLEVHGELVLRLPERLMFDVGEAEMSAEGKRAVEAISDELHDRPIRIRVEGHTDSAPIHTPRFPSNWELSTARAMAVVALMLDTQKIEPFRLAAAGYGEHHPIASNDSAEGRAMNRRVDVIVVAEVNSKEPKP